jgi:hypothetical protein
MKVMKAPSSKLEPSKALKEIFLSIANKDFFKICNLEVDGYHQIKSHKELLDYVTKGVFYEELEVTRDIKIKIELYPDVLSTRSLVRVLLNNKLKVRRV